MVAADDWYALGFRYQKAGDIFPGDDYLPSYVEQVVQRTCQTRSDVDENSVFIDEFYYQKDFPIWVRKHG